MNEITFIARLSESRHDAEWNFDNITRLSKENVRVEFLPSKGMTIDGFDMTFEITSVHASMETGRVAYVAEAKKNFTWFPNSREPTPCNALIKKLKGHGFSKL